MNRRGGGFGLVLLVVVMAVILLLVARSWKTVAPQAIEVSNPDQPFVVDDHGDTGAGEAIRSGQLPGLRDMNQQTDAHAKQLSDALAEIE